MKIKLSLKDRILKNVVKTDSGCWIWQGRASGGMGYGTICIDHKYISAHRASYMAFHGPIPEGMYVCHTCDVPLCVNPEHLYAATPKQNQADMYARKRGRKPSGERNHSAKLTEGIVRQILGMSGLNKDIAAVFGVDPSTISVIRSRKAWKHVSAS